ncbi:hypothetical protein AVEN_20370-1 [Araneus ventricosus]|uniref:Uncharacterized protein n=1 Tax=Araneus ventricosus TaxID=182803 RepID=A0A4Y2FT50_ARAVE|nr:hypothetical protein AVEN_20370-1 [Araneus ventricosus]
MNLAMLNCCQQFMMMTMMAHENDDALTRHSSPNFRTTSARGRLTLNIRFKVHQVDINDRPLVESNSLIPKPKPYHKQPRANSCMQQTFGGIGSLTKPVTLRSRS